MQYFSAVINKTKKEYILSPGMPFSEYAVFESVFPDLIVQLLGMYWANDKVMLIPQPMLFGNSDYSELKLSEVDMLIYGDRKDVIYTFDFDGSRFEFSDNNFDLSSAAFKQIEPQPCNKLNIICSIEHRECVDLSLYKDIVKAIRKIKDFRLLHPLLLIIAFPSSDNLAFQYRGTTQEYVGKWCDTRLFSTCRIPTGYSVITPVFIEGKHEYRHLHITTLDIKVILAELSSVANIEDFDI